MFEFRDLFSLRQDGHPGEPCQMFCPFFKKWLAQGATCADEKDRGTHLGYLRGMSCCFTVPFNSFELQYLYLQIIKGLDTFIHAEAHTSQLIFAVT